METNREVRELVDAVFREEGARVLATLIRMLGDFDSAEDAMQEAFSAALKQWARDGVPANPRAWLVSAGRFKAIDAIRRNARSTALLKESVEAFEEVPVDEGAIEDDRLRLIFTCCHPSLPREGQIALTLREVCGLTTEEIARALMAPTVNVAQRIVRAKAKIRDERIPYELPGQDELSQRLDNVLRVTYLVFNEGYYASSGYSLTRESVSAEAIRLGRLLAELIPVPEVYGLLGLMLLHESRRAARATAAGDLILLGAQDRSQWNRELMAEGLGFVRRALATDRLGTYSLQAAIAGVHAESASAEETDWDAIVGIYDRLLEIHPSPVIELNRAVAVAERDGPSAGLELVDELLESSLGEYGLAHSMRADFCRRLDRKAEAGEAYRRALELTTLEPERRFLIGRLEALGTLGLAEE